jgi:hypothetical protein
MTDTLAQVQPPKGIRVATGGASGADTYWLKCIEPYASSVELWLVKKVKATYTPKEAVSKQMTPEQAEQAYAAVEASHMKTKRPMFKRGSCAAEFVARNYWIVKDADMVVAVGDLVPQYRHKLLSGGCGVDGGTGWACQLYADMQPCNRSLNLFLHDGGTWLRCHKDEKGILSWSKSPPPVIYSNGKYALIGTRSIRKQHTAAIKGVCNNTQSLLQVQV